MLTHDQIMNMTMARVPHGELAGAVICKHRSVEGYDVVFGIDSVHKEYYNLLRAASFLYRIIDEHKEAMRATVEHLESAGLDSLVPHFLNMQSGLAVAQDLAVNGLEDLARRSDILKKNE
jgi:hypothetical protein